MSARWIDGKLVVDTPTRTESQKQVAEINKLRGKLQRADKKIKELCATSEHLDDMCMRQSVQISTMHRLCHEAQLGIVVANKNTISAEHTIEELNYKLQQADKNIIQKIGVIDSLHGYKNLYEEGQKIRRGLAATIIEKDKSIGELVDRVNDECEMNTAIAHDLAVAKGGVKYWKSLWDKYHAEFMTCRDERDVLRDEVAELRDEYEPKLVRCDKFKSCRAFGCYHWSPHQPNHVCGMYACCDHNCIQWKGDA